MEPMIYDNHVVREHSLYARCPSTLNEISNRDYPGTDYFNPDIIGLDMDDYERRTCLLWPRKQYGRCRYRVFVRVKTRKRVVHACC